MGFDAAAHDDREKARKAHEAEFERMTNPGQFNKFPVRVDLPRIVPARYDNSRSELLGKVTPTPEEPARKRKNPNHLF
jgi:hypothetical protein